MSKNKKKIKIDVNKKNTKIKKSYKNKVIIGTVIGILIIAAIIVLAVVFSKNPNAELTDKTWTSYIAYDSGNNEVDISNVYNNNYTQYRGSLTFNNDGTFEIWLTAGDPDDGTHKGIYTYKDGVINVQYDSGEKAEFQVSKGEDDKILYIVVPYTNDNDTYSVYFN